MKAIVLDERGHPRPEIRISGVAGPIAMQPGDRLTITYGRAGHGRLKIERERPELAPLRDRHAAE